MDHYDTFNSFYLGLTVGFVLGNLVGIPLGFRLGRYPRVLNAVWTVSFILVVAPTSFEGSYYWMSGNWLTPSMLKPPLGTELTETLMNCASITGFICGQCIIGNIAGFFIGQPVRKQAEQAEKEHAEQVEKDRIAMQSAIKRVKKARDLGWGTALGAIVGTVVTITFLPEVVALGAVGAVVGGITALASSDD